MRKRSSEKWVPGSRDPLGDLASDAYHHGSYALAATRPGEPQARKLKVSVPQLARRPANRTRACIVRHLARDPSIGAQCCVAVAAGAHPTARGARVAEAVRNQQRRMQAENQHEKRARSDPLTAPPVESHRAPEAHERSHLALVLPRRHRPFGNGAPRVHLGRPQRSARQFCQDQTGSAGAVVCERPCEASRGPLQRREKIPNLATPESPPCSEHSSPVEPENLYPGNSPRAGEAETGWGLRAAVGESGVRAFRQRATPQHPGPVGHGGCGYSLLGVTRLRWPGFPAVRVTNRRRIKVPRLDVSGAALNSASRWAAALPLPLAHR